MKKVMFNSGQRRTYADDEAPIKFPRVPFEKMEVIEMPPLEIHPKFADRNLVVISDLTEFIPNVTAEAIDWWWGNMDKGYNAWAPGEHYGFDWIVPPCEVGYEGSVEASYEFDPNDPIILTRVSIKDNYPFTECFEHCWLTKTHLGPLEMNLCHMHQDVEGGVQWRTVNFATAEVAAQVAQLAAAGKMPPLAEHMEYESGRVNVVIPPLYELWKDHPDPWENVHFNLTTERLEDGTWAHKYPNLPPEIEDYR